MASVAPYPKTHAEFDELFATEASCLDYYRKLRWPEGIRCAKCGGSDGWPASRARWICKQCKRAQSVTTGTLLHRTRYPLKMWFRVMWQICEQKNGISALGLQRAMGFGSYHTAWEWLQRIRGVMVFPGRSRLTGEVEVDETFVGGVKHGVRGRGAAGKVLVLVAVEVRGSKIGRARLQIISAATAATLLDAVEDLVAPASQVVTDGLASDAGLPGRGYTHPVSRPNTSEVGDHPLPKAHRVASLLKRWLLGTHQGGGSAKHLHAYLDAFVFRFNRRTSRSRGLLFRRLIEQTIVGRS